VLQVAVSKYTCEAAAEGVESTNNAAERALRHAVCWRKISYGTNSPAGSRFVERMLTVVATYRQQGYGVLDFLTDSFRAALAGAIPTPRYDPGPTSSCS
jgi:transposase